MDILFIIGLPRSGTSLVYNKIHEITGRSALTLGDAGLDTTKISPTIQAYHKHWKGKKTLAEMEDFPYIQYVRKCTEKGSWVAKSTMLSSVPDLIDIFPEASFLWCLRDPGETMASVQDYFQATGLRWPYNPVDAVKKTLQIAKTHPERFSWIDAKTIPEWESNREPTKTFTTLDLKHQYELIKGNVHNVKPEQLEERYRIDN